MTALNILSRACNVGFSISCCLLAAGLSVAHAKNNSPAETNPETEIQAFIEKAANELELPESEIANTLAKASKNQQVLDAIARPWEAKPWYQYFPIFLTEKRIAKGVEFWNTHEKTLSKAEQEFGVPAHIITAIIGVETFYGTYKGKYSVLDSLYSLGFYYPPRSTFFKKELLEYLRLIKEENFDAAGVMGSYAGAMGWGQFISSSYRHYAVDFDGDNVRDLLNNPQDAIGSVANYFKQHKWRRGEPVIFKAEVSGATELPLEDGLEYTHRWQYLNGLGIELQTKDFSPSAEQAAKLFAFELENGNEYWVGLDNFYVITRYNHSPLYAMVVYQLSEAIKARRNDA